MSLTVSIIITGIAIGLLVIYGADVAAGGGTGDGFLPFDHKIRGFGIGTPSIILPIIAFFISRNKPSYVLGGMIILSGILILVGGAFVISNADLAQAEESGRNVMAESIPLIIIGAIIIGLGIIKLRKSQKAKL